MGRREDNADLGRSAGVTARHRSSSTAVMPGEWCYDRSGRRCSKLNARSSSGIHVSGSVVAGSSSNVGPARSASPRVAGLAQLVDRHRATPAHAAEPARARQTLPSSPLGRRCSGSFLK